MGFCDSGCVNLMSAFFLLYQKNKISTLLLLFARHLTAGTTSAIIT